MIVFPRAKINIGLRVTGKRIDGYHDIETIFYPIGLSDALEFVVSEERTEKDIIHITGIDTGGMPEDNLVYKAIVSLRAEISVPFLKIHLHKAIPVGAGLGGGSSDAAYLLKTVNRQFSLELSRESLESIALKLGSDCPFFINGVPSFGSGRGEILTPIKPVLSGFYLVVLNPGIRISTAEVYLNSKSNHPVGNLIQMVEMPVEEWKGFITNDFEDYVFYKYPVIGEIKDSLYSSKAIFSSLSGSGSSVYGVFSEKPKLKDELADYIIWEGVL